MVAVLLGMSEKRADLIMVMWFCSPTRCDPPLVGGAAFSFSSLPCLHVLVLPTSCEPPFLPLGRCCFPPLMVVILSAPLLGWFFFPPPPLGVGAFLRLLGGVGFLPSGWCRFPHSFRGVGEERTTPH